MTRKMFRQFVAFLLKKKFAEADPLYKDEVYEIAGICMAVYKEPGYGFLEKVYKDAMEMEFI